MRIRVITLNVWNTEGDELRTAVINRELSRLQPDLLAMQEVVGGNGPMGLSRLVENLGLTPTHQREVQPYTPPFSDRYGGSAIATRWPHQVVEVLDLRGTDVADLPWSTLAAIVELPVGEVLFICTTASWRPSAEAARERQAIALADLEARHRRDLPTIIAGDLNAEPDAGSLRFLTGRQALQGRSVCFNDAWSVAGGGPGHTWTVENPNALSVAAQIVRQPGTRRRFDYILVGSRDAHPDAHTIIETAKLVLNAPVDGVWASDHFGVMADLDIGHDDQPAEPEG